jgi:uncharacterized Zn finger protein (UPF0148 family)
METPLDPRKCEVCETKLIEIDGEWFCASCESLSGFELVPDRDSFRL